MSDIFRDSALGYLLRTVSRGSLFRYTEDYDEFVLPDTYAPRAKDVVSTIDTPLPEREQQDQPRSEKPEADTYSQTPSNSDDGSGANVAPIARVDTQDRRLDLERVTSQADLERAVTAATMKKTASRPIIPTRTAEGVTLVDWYTTDDRSNPQNWSSGKKAFVTAQIVLYTMAVYMGSSLFTGSAPAVIEIFGVSQTVASLGLALYVLGYGTGPLVFSPLSEIPVVGRNPPYIITFFMFVLFTIGAAVVENVPGLMVLRFLQGFFGSPCLATAGASLGDMYDILKLPYLMTIWVSGAVSGPSLGPLVAGFSVPARDWHWSMWELLWLSGPIFIMLFVALPETSASTILLRRATRLRRVTGDSSLKAQSEIDQQKLTASAILAENLLHPAEITVKDPAVLFATIYTAISYAIYYSFFESFPLVFIDMHGFNLGQLGLCFLAIIVGVIISVIAYFAYLYYYVNPRIRAHGLGAPEMRLIPALLASVLVPVGLFLFAWTSRPDIHWVVPLIGLAMNNAGVFIVFQCIFMYIPLSYPQYAASLFAANDFARSALSFAAILFSTPMFRNLGVDKGLTVLASFTILGVPGIWALYYLGPRLRAKSKFTLKG